VLSATEHRERVNRMLARLADAWPSAGSQLWHSPVRYRDGNVADVLMTWWREVRIHLVDLEAGVEPETWSEAFCDHLFGFLAPRLPPHTGVELRFSGGVRKLIGEPDPSGVSLIVEGDRRDIALWLAGRTPARLPAAFAAGRRVALPALSPWPSTRR
jgi:maleylpyruvate isomerase